MKLPILGLILSMAASAAMAQPQQKPSPPPELVLAVQAIQQHKLTSLSTKCLRFGISRQPVNPEIAEIRVFEKHNAECGGDPQTQPRLFDMQVNKKTKQIWTDARTPGTMERLK